MCELFGASLKRQADLTGYLTEFFSHSNKHPHGWGIAFDKDGKTCIVKEPVCANESRIISGVVERLGPQKDLLAHIRYATVGSLRKENCHPFTGLDASGRQWTLIHNGTVYSGLALTKYLDLQTGDTDSERIFMYLIERVNEAISHKGQLDVRDRFDIVDSLVNRLSPRNKLNLMIYDGEALYVHKNMSNTLSYKSSENGVILSTSPLDGDGWQDLPMCQAIAFREGEKIFEGKSHGNVFVPTLDSITVFDAMNI